MTQVLRFENVTVLAKANVYFDGKVVSHTLLEADGRKRTLGIIYPGSYTFNTAAPELMTITAGECQVSVAGGEVKPYAAGETFSVPGNSAFEISVASGLLEYLCDFEE